MLPCTDTVSVDFEKAAMSAGSVSRRDCDGLLFPSRSERHSQSERDWAEDGSTKPTMKFCSYVQCLPALAFVLPDDVMEAESQPTTVDQLDELTTFFEHTYIRGRRRRGRAATYGPAPHSPSKPEINTVCVFVFWLLFTLDFTCF